MNKFNKQLLKTELSREFKHHRFKQYTFSMEFIEELFNKFDFYGMTQNSYCCRELEDCCWQEVYEDGIWNWSYKDVKRFILSYVASSKKYLYNTKKYGFRFYVSNEASDTVCIYIYLRDKSKYDLYIWFSNTEN